MWLNVEKLQLLSVVEVDESSYVFAFDICLPQLRLLDSSTGYRQQHQLDRTSTTRPSSYLSCSKSREEEMEIENFS